MQFFPDYTSVGVSALGGVSLKDSSFTIPATNDFLDSFNKELAASGVKPVVDVSVKSASPTRFRSVKQDVSAKLSSEDINTMLEKLRLRGVDDSALTGIEGLLSSGTPLTLGNIMGALKNNVRATGELDEEHVRNIASALQKMQFPAEEADEIIALMENGRGAQALKHIRTRAAELGEEGFSLTGAETHALMRGLDLSENAMKKITALLVSELPEAGEEAGVGGIVLGKLLEPAVEEFAIKKAEEEKLAGEMNMVIGETLREKKSRERNEPVADTRGSRLTDRAERRMRDDLTAKANGFDKSREELQEEAALADEEMAREQSDYERQNAFAENRKTVSALRSDQDATRADTTPSKAKEAFSPIITRVEAASGMSAPVQGQAVTGQPASTVSQRQEVFAQVEQGLLRQLADGSRQMTLHLNPAELGQVTLVLSVKGGEIRALIRAENPETTAALSDQMNQLRATLEDQGLKVAQLDVETQLPQDTTREQWSDMTQFNREREMREHERFLRLAKLRRESGETLARDMQSKSAREEISASGLHLIA